MVDMSVHIDARPAQAAAAPSLPPATSLPDNDPNNPWRPALYAPYHGGMLTIEGIGTRPLEDFEHFPVSAELPHCYVRLSQDASVREDRVPKETVIYSRERAQSCLMHEMKAVGCRITRALPHKSGLTIFTTPANVANQFATKVWEAVMTVLKEDKPCLLYTSPSPRDGLLSRMPSSA